MTKQAILFAFVGLVIGAVLSGSIVAAQMKATTAASQQPQIANQQMQTTPTPLDGPNNMGMMDHS